MIVPPGTSEIQLTPIAFHTSNNIVINKSSDLNKDYFDGKRSREMSEAIPLELEGVTELFVQNTFVGSVQRDLSIEPRPRVYTLSVREESESSLAIETIAGVPSSEISEDTVIHLIADVASNFKDTLTYQWYQISEGKAVLENVQANRPELVFEIPADFIEGEADSVDIELLLTVVEATNTAAQASQLVSFTVNKTDNDTIESIIRETNEGLETLVIREDPDGMPPVDELSYQWQQRDIDNSEWRDADDSDDSNEYSVMQNKGDILYRVQISYTDGQGYDNEEILDLYRARTNIDDDDDGLIDIYYLEDLDKVRYQPDGNAYNTSHSTRTKITAGCPNNICKGYELRRDLDFNADDSYADAINYKSLWTVNDYNDRRDTGWNPMGINAIFNGNGYTISNLQINGVGNQSRAGLFNTIGEDAKVEHLNLNTVTIRILDFETTLKVGGIAGENRGVILNSHISHGNIRGSLDFVGGLVGSNSGDIFYSSVHADVVGTGSSDDNGTGGLVGRNWEGGEIHYSYAIGSVRGRCRVGGLVGRQFSSNRTDMENISTVKNSYAVVGISADGGCFNLESDSDFGGLVGVNAGSDIVNSYAVGRSSILDSGLVGNDVSNPTSTNITYSYWDTDLNGMGSAAGEGKTTSELQTPTAASGIYMNWSPGEWDFGTETQYPVIKYSSSTEIIARTVCSDTPSQELPQCGAIMPNQRIGLQSLELSEDNIRLREPFNYTLLNYEAIAGSEVTQTRFTPTANNSSATITIHVAGDDDTDYSRGNGVESELIMLSRSTPTMVLITVATEGERSVQYTMSIEVLEDFAVEEAIAATIDDDDDIERDESGSILVNEGQIIELNVAPRGGDRRNYRYRWSVTIAATDIATATGLIQDEQQGNAAITVSIPANFIKSSSDSVLSTQLTFTATIDDGFHSTQTRSIVFNVRKINNGDPEIDLVVSTSTISVRSTADPDGDGTYSYVWFKKGIDDSSYMFIGATAATYTIPDEDLGGSNRYQVSVDYTDEQGYILLRFSRTAIRTAIDDDDDGRIDIYYLEDLDAIRYQLDGSGYKESGTADKITRGCADICNGYELRRSLDFATTQSYINVGNKDGWTTGSGWQPIGDSSAAFSTQFRANTANDDSLTISNLMINRPDIEGAALFGVSTATGRILGIRLLDADVKGRFTSRCFSRC